MTLSTDLALTSTGIASSGGPLRTIASQKIPSRRNLAAISSNFDLAARFAAKCRGAVPVIPVSEADGSIVWTSKTFALLSLAWNIA